MFKPLIKQIESLKSDNDTINARLEVIEQAITTILQILENDSGA